MARAREGMTKLVVEADVNCSLEARVPMAARLAPAWVDSWACDLAARRARLGFSGDSGKRTEVGSGGGGGSAGRLCGDTECEAVIL